jgi:CheY-like chemotaxis protein
MYSNQYQLDLSDKMIAIVDDDLASIRYFEVLLKTTGASVITFMNGTDLINFISGGLKDVDMVLIDYLIPYVNGIDCARQIRKANKTIPIAMVTAYYTRESKEEALLAGCNEYILKPVVPDKVLALLEKYLVHREFAHLSE